MDLKVLCGFEFPYMYFNRDRLLAIERAEKERQDLEKKRERDAQLKKEMDKIKEQVLTCLFSLLLF